MSREAKCTPLICAMKAPERVPSVTFFGRNLDPGCTKDIEPNPILGRDMKLPMMLLSR
jgi:hypothetical protein